MNIMKTKSKDGVNRQTCGLIIGTLLALAAGLVGCGNGGSSAAIPSEARIAGFGGVL